MTFRRLAAAWTIAALLGLVVAMLPPSTWVAELADPWRLHVALALAVGAIAVARLRVTPLLLAVALAVSVPPIASRWTPRATPVGAHRVRLVTFNALRGNEAKDRAVAWLGASGADVIVLQEVDGAWAVALVDVPGFPHRAVYAREGHFGVAILSRLPLRDVEVVPTGGLPTSTLVATVEAPGGPLRVLATHTMPPFTPSAAAERAHDLEDVGRLVGAGARRTVLAGDLNAPPWAPSIRALLAATGLEDGGRGFGLRPTWPSPLAAVGIPIDHVLVSPDLGVASWEVGPDLGSDHRPVVVEVGG